jgi:hypothetical protein
MESSALRAIMRVTARERLLIASARGVAITTADLIVMRQRAAADPARRRSKALREQADIELVRGDVRDPDEGW